MPRIIAIEWDNREARVAVATARRGQSTIEDVFAISFDGTAGKVEIGAQLAAGLARRRTGRGQTLVAVGRTSIELKLFSLPPAPDEDLPEMVRFQAPREFTSFAEGWPLDFIPLGGDAEQSRTVLAATIDPELVKQINATCEAAGLKADHLVVRPCSAASLLSRHRDLAPAEPQLLIDLLADEMDLTVMIDGRVVFTRTARLPHDALSVAADEKLLVAEVRRTLAAAQNQLGGQAVGRVWLYGGDDQAQLAQRLAEALSLPTELFDPFEDVPLDRRLAGDLPAQRGRFAPVLGMLIDAAHEQPHAIDFIQPKRRPEKPSGRPRALLYAGAAGLLLAIGAGWYWSKLSALDREISDLKTQERDRQVQVKKYQDVQKKVDEIDRWMAGDICWLNELERLAEKLPPADQVMLTQLRVGSSVVGGGDIDLEGFVKAPASVAAMEAGLRDPNHQVEGQGFLEEPDKAPYKWSFGTRIVVKPAETR